MRPRSFLLLAASLVQAPSTRGPGTNGIDLQPCQVANVPVPIRCGTYMVNEDRTHRRGRRIPLYVRVVRSFSAEPHSDPLVFVSPGGPGITNSDVVAGAYARGWQRDRDVVMVDLRGTSGPDRLDCDTPGSPEAPLRYLQSAFDSVVARKCRTLLETRANLSEYTTANAMDDLYDALVALGFHRVNLLGVSGGTREVLEFIRRHTAMVRAAIIEGAAPVSFKNPLPHAAAAQEALDSLFAQCARDTACNDAFPRLRYDFARLRETAIRHSIVAPAPPELGGRDTIVELTWPMIAEVIRTMSYTTATERALPFVIHQATLGDYAPLITAGVQSSRRTRAAIRFGFLLSQTCLEDVPRISDAEVTRETANTYLGDARVRQQRAACRQWVHGSVRGGDFAPVRGETPVFILSGTIDPVTRPRFGADVARYLPHSVHVIAPGGHVPSGPCIDAMERQFLAAPTSEVDTSCVRSMTLPPFRVR